MAAIAILTGASSGIGAAAARRFVDHGDTVINISRRQCPVAGVETLATDFADEQSVANSHELERKYQHQVFLIFCISFYQFEILSLDWHFLNSIYFT